jgi:uncharacterized tellurite resistance protein B-like protein
MTADVKVKTLVKILIGAAWIDGIVQPEEREYLLRVAKEKGVADDPELQPLLHGLRSVKSAECYVWVNEYLGDHPTPESCQQLIESISGLIYSDGTVATEEAKLLNNLQQLDPTNKPSDPESSSVLKAIRDLYQRWLSKLNA